MDNEAVKHKCYLETIQAPIEPLKQLKTTLFREKCIPRVQEIFFMHGIALEIKEACCLVTFPAGTIRQEILPRPPYSVRNRILLPDGYEMQEVLERHDLFSSLGFPDQDFSDC